jgi:2-polyprenyl-3-methyl-5-hydroxy-6-metoxy-1,4-benzoquinol methylase
MFTDDRKCWWNGTIRLPKKRPIPPRRPSIVHCAGGEIERNLEGVTTILDIGGASGVFSIPLGGRGFQVTHLDLSPEMLTIAREKARDVPGIEFVEGKASDLTQFSDRSFVRY